MDNLHWLRYVHSALAAREILDRGNFRLSDPARGSALSQTARDRVPLVHSDLILPQRPRTPKAVSEAFLKVQSRQFCTTVDGVVYLQPQLAEQEVDVFKAEFKYLPPKNLAPWQAFSPGRLINTYQFVSQFGGIEFTTRLERPMLDLGGLGKVAVNTLQVEYTSPSDLLWQTIYLGEDFAALDPYGYGCSYTGALSSEKLLEIIPAQSAKFAVRAADSPINTSSPLDAANHFVGLIQALHTRTHDMVRIV